MRALALLALVLVTGSCGFPEYQFPEEGSVPEPMSSCDPNPCLNEGECVEVDGGHACLCPAGFRGDECETDVDDCASAPCQNGSMCVDGVDTYTCECEIGFKGRHCEENRDDCTPNPCKNGGFCRDGVADYTCQCLDGFSGDTCAGAAPATCLVLLQGDPSAKTGVYPVDPDGPGAGKAPIDARCDMETDGGGWTLVGREAEGDTGTFRFLANEEGLASEIAQLEGSGLMGLRFAGLYEEVRIVWQGESEGYAQFRPQRELFVNTVDTAIPVDDFETSDAALSDWVGTAGAAVFCRASRSIDVRPGDTSWGLKPASDENVECGCSGGQWKGQGAYYGGSLNATSCTGYGGGWAAVRGEGEPKGGYTTYQIEIWVR